MNYLKRMPYFLSMSDNDTSGGDNHDEHDEHDKNDEHDEHDKNDEHDEHDKNDEHDERITALEKLHQELKEKITEFDKLFREYINENDIDVDDVNNQDIRNIMDEIEKEIK